MNKLSLIVPTYRKVNVVIDQLTDLYSHLSKYKFDFEIILVVDGKIDNTYSLVNSFKKRNNLENLKLVGYKENRGKGYAIRKGIRHATGDVIGYIDADRDIELRTLDLLIKEMEKGAIAAIPSKLHKKSNVHFSPLRKIISKSFRVFNQIFVPLPEGVEDVSCGVKLFKGNLIKHINKYLTVDGFAIDTEILFYINKLGYNVNVTPFYANINTSETSVTLKKTFVMITDILNLSRSNHYNSNVVENIKVRVNID